jgi:serine/threonine protein kinase
VCEAINTYSNENFAIKKIPLNKNELEIAFKASKLIEKLRSDYIVECYEIWIEDNYLKNRGLDNEQRKSLDKKFNDLHKPILLHIQMEYCYKTLPQILIQLHKEFNTKKFQILSTSRYFISSELFKEILESLKFLHKQNIIHTNLKPENVFITNGNNGRFIKIGDFWLAKIHEIETRLLAEYNGLIKYIAPEVIEKRSYDSKADIYSLGVIVQELFNIDINE